MSPKERVTATLRGETPDRVPVVLFFMSAVQHEMAREDITWNEALHSSYKLQKIVRQQHDLYGVDNLFLPLDFRVAGEAFGGRSEYQLKCGGGMRMPVISSPVLQGKDGIDALQVPDGARSGRCPTVIKAIGNLSESHGSKVPLVGFLSSPLDTATDLIAGGYSTILPMMAVDPMALHRLLAKITEFQIEFGKAMVAAGADALATVGGGFNSLTIGETQFREFVTPYIKQMVSATGVPFCFHQCQNATPFLAEMKATGAQALAFHELVDLREAKRQYGSDVVLAGNIPVSGVRSVMSEGTTEDVRKMARAALEVGMPGSKYWLSTGCEVHHTVKEENIKALVSSAVEFGVY